MERKNATPQVALTSNLLVTRDGDDGTTRTVLGHQMGGETSSSQSDDGRSLTLEGRFDGGNSHRVRRIRRSHDLQREERY